MHMRCTTRTVTAEIRAEISRQGLTQADVATAAGLNRSSLTRKLRGKQSLTITEAAAVADALGVPLSEFLRRAEQGTAA